MVILSGYIMQVRIGVYEFFSFLISGAPSISIFMILELFVVSQYKYIFTYLNKFNLSKII